MAATFVVILSFKISGSYQMRKTNTNILNKMTSPPPSPSPLEGEGWVGGILGILIIVFWMSGYSLSQPLNNFKPGSEPDGFGDIKWGTDLSTLKNMKFSRTDPSYGGIDVYLRLGQVSRIGGASLKNIEYLFWKRIFSGVRIIAEGVSEYKSFNTHS